MNGTEATTAPFLRIVRGRPDDAEIAALTAATAALSATGATEADDRGRLSMWADRSAMVRHSGGRRPLRPGPGAWRASALPR